MRESYNKESSRKTLIFVVTIMAVVMVLSITSLLMLSHK